MSDQVQVPVPNPSFMENLDEFKAVLAFFMVYFNVTCFNRFWCQYETMMRALQQTNHVLSLSLGMLSSDPASLLRLVRYVVALNYTFVWTIWEKDDTSIAMARSQQVFTAEEATELESCIHPDNTVHAWVVKELNLQRIAGSLPPPVMSSVVTTVEQIKESWAEIGAHERMPIPQSYFYVLNLMTYVYLMADMLTENAIPRNERGDLEVILGVWVTQFAFFLIRELGLLLADPWGEDFCDLNVESVLDEILESADELLMHAPPNVQKHLPSPVDVELTA